MTRTPVINIVGATATGKSDLAIALAQRLDGEIINSDAMQFYRGMDIGTAKLAPEDRGGIPHHLLDILDVTQEASVSAFQREARELIADIRARGKQPILVGGSGLYVRAATDVMEFPGTDPALRARLEAQIAEVGTQSMHARLVRVDPAAARRIGAGDARRIVRALEVVALTGRTFSAQLPEYTYAMPTVQIGLRIERAVLHERIAARVAAMFDAGWVGEVRTLLTQGLAQGKTAGRAIGYRQIMELLAGTVSRAEAIESTVVRTRQFARRQETWFRRDPRIAWVDAQDTGLLEHALRLVAEAAGPGDGPDPEPTIR
ncbi:tRNA (adenosine(37)-N6)-dimethylallyltransferase MiaA [Brevibacterium sp. 50QC2O2]|uniref:tRNA (adenosine(37)-N6)-dimethylallyltransferase MiaA n=1 Tax=Brevibacterium TaxID=1696 RepID=UPI00211BA627|nr:MULTISPECIES: tRNA (adenosine(37)-N6)-dimethylallyltransferase MiaA [unclassified Brevibacterium]MCQ9367692.1 tRNA (adenosine(37)-N6)-dimethylallyltransferase MiaA [Brevibacterium sp. 91QC2O2]MCQ9385002.1 tRNA (adenosine(37)-N6)-dimethylallyltransferase MiaA [Brevibacterium sp. 68QC2CO]MCQ9387951.1 tRNA (adenosine(37)-N6)-dimethylallyltransferase MiaA [Brevibacterium sp. 50QC2O2]